MSRLIAIGFALVILGILVTFIGTFILVLKPLMEAPQTTNVTVTGGAAGCIVIFFIPICFGTGNQPQLSMILTIMAVTLTVIIIIFSFIFMRRLISKPQPETFI